jgi:hypothetical protein
MDKLMNRYLRDFIGINFGKRGGVGEPALPPKFVYAGNEKNWQYFLSGTILIKRESFYGCLREGVFFSL